MHACTMQPNQWLRKTNDFSEGEFVGLNEGEKVKVTLTNSAFVQGERALKLQF